jgi:hypothetical protein
MIKDTSDPRRALSRRLLHLLVLWRSDWQEDGEPDPLRMIAGHPVLDQDFSFEILDKRPYQNKPDPPSTHSRLPFHALVKVLL